MEAGFVSCDWSKAGLVVTVSEPKAIFEDGTTFVAGSDYSLTLEKSDYHWIQHAIAAYRKDNILKVEAQPLGTLFAGTVGTQTEANSSPASKVIVRALDGEHFAVAALVGGTLTCYFYSPGGTNGSCLLAATTVAVPTDITDFDCVAYGDNLYVVYVNTADPKRLKVCKFTYTGAADHDNYVTAVESTNLSDPKIRIQGTQMYASWKENTGNYLYMARFDDSSFSSWAVPSKLTIYNDDVSMDPDYDFLPLKDKIHWLCLFSGPIVREFETNLSGGARTTITDVDADNGCYMPQIGRNGWGSIYRAWVADSGVAVTGNVQITNAGVAEDLVKTYTQSYPGASLAQAKLYVDPMKNADLLVVDINVHTGNHGYNRVNFKGNSVYSHTVIPGAGVSAAAGVAALESGAAVVAVADGAKTYVSYVPTADHQTKFSFPINGIELVRATTNVSSGIDESWAPRPQRSSEGSLAANTRVEANRIRVSIPTRGITREIVNPYGGIQDALDLVNSYTPAVNDKAYIDIGPGKYPLLVPVDLDQDDNIEIRGHNSTLETHTVYLSDTYDYFIKVRAHDHITIRDLNVVPADVNSIVGIELDDAEDISILNNTVYGTPAIYVNNNVSNFVIDNNYCEAYGGDPIIVET